VAFSGVQSEQRAGAINLLHEKGFRDLTIKGGESAQATVFFMPESDMPAFSTADLQVWLVDPDNYGTAFAKVRIAGLRSIEDKPRDQEQIPTATSPAAPQPRVAMSPASAPASTQPPAIGVAGLRQGDRWEYTIVDSRNGRAASRAFEIEQVDEKSIVERIEMEDRSNRTAAHRSGAYLNMPGGMQFAPYYFAFQPDAATSPIGEVKAEGGDACASRPDVGYSYQLTYDCEIRADFLGIESVTVPAGTFPAHAVRITVDAQAWGGHNAHRFNLINARFWISAKAGRIVKAVITHEADPPWTETMELVSYRTGDRMTGSRPTAVSR